MSTKVLHLFSEQINCNKFKELPRVELFRFHDIGGEPFNNGMVHKARARSMGYFSCSLSYSLLDIQMIGVQWK